MPSIESQPTQNPPVGPVTFTYTVSVPAGTAGDQFLAASGIVRFDGALSQPIATPSPLLVPQITMHSADTNADFRISLVELTRVIELYNTRLGTTRTERRAMRAFRRTGADDVAQLAEESGMPEARAQMLLPLLRQGDMSLDATYTDRGPAIDRLGDDAGTPEDALLYARTTRGVREALDAALVVLNPRERRIVEARMIAEDPRTLEQLGAEMGVSKERVRQIEERARMKLRERLAAFAPGA